MNTDIDCRYAAFFLLFVGLLLCANAAGIHVHDVTDALADVIEEVISDDPLEDTQTIDAIEDVGTVADNEHETIPVNKKPPLHDTSSAYSTVKYPDHD